MDRQAVRQNLNRRHRERNYIRTFVTEFEFCSQRLCVFPKVCRTVAERRLGEKCPSNLVATETNCSILLQKLLVYRKTLQALIYPISGNKFVVSFVIFVSH